MTEPLPADQLTYPDGWPCKQLRPAGTIAKDCTYPYCDCGDAELAAAFDNPKVLMFPILPEYEP